MIPTTNENVKTRADYIRDAETCRQQSHDNGDWERAKFWQMDALIAATLANATSEPIAPTDYLSVRAERDQATGLLVALVNELEWLNLPTPEHDLGLNIVFLRAQSFVRDAARHEEAVQFAETQLRADYEAVVKQRDELLVAAIPICEILLYNGDTHGEKERALIRAVRNVEQANTTPANSESAAG